MILRERKSQFVRLFTKTPPDVCCPHFYELILSNGCPYNCSYCYLQLTFRGKKNPVLFTNNWHSVQQEIERVEAGVFSTGELADSLAIIPPLLPPLLEYFRGQSSKYLLLTTKSCNIDLFRELEPIPQVIISFSINSLAAAASFERLAPSPLARLKAATKLLEKGWRVRIRLDPIIWEVGLGSYRNVCKDIAALKPERVTVGTLRQYPALYRFAPDAPKKGLRKSTDGRMRYTSSVRLHIYQQIADWLGFQPALCKETKEIWDALNWTFYGCNCTV